MKLELKHLVSYLPNKLYILIEEDIFIEYNEFLEEEQYVEKGIYKLNGITEGTSYLEEGVFLSSTDDNIGDSFVERKHIKPILFPLPALTKEITINGETFVPMEKLSKINFHFTFPKKIKIINDKLIELYDEIVSRKFGFDNLTFISTGFEDKLLPCYNQLDLFNKLFEWKFDVFGLIDACLAEQVTEDFNPYK